MTTFLSPVFGAGAQILDNSGKVLAGGKIYTYLAGTTTPAATFTTSVGDVSNANPIILDSSGRPPQEIWLLSGSAYKFVITNSAGTPIGYTYDNISGINDFVSLSASEWVTGSDPTYVDPNQFLLVGDQTAIYLAGRRLKSIVTAGTAYSTIVSSVYATGLTTVTVLNDSTPLDSGLSAVYYGLIAPTPNSLPTSSVTAASIQQQSATAVTSTGTAGAYAIAPVPAIPYTQVNQRFYVKFHVANTAAPTISINGTTALNLVKMNADGTLSNLAAADIPINWRSDVIVVTSTQAMVVGIPGTLGGYVTLTGTETLTNKTLTTVSLKETKVAVAAANIDLATGNCFSKTITALTTFTVSNVPAAGTVGSFILDLTNGGAFAITWWAGVKWASGTAPALTASGRDVLGFFTHDGGTTWNGLVLGKAMA